MQERHFDRKLAGVGAELDAMAQAVDRALELAVDGLANPRPSLGKEARMIESEVDALDLALEQECQLLMTLQGPVAGDLRRLLVALRIGAVLEQIGDLAESVARRARYLARHDPIPPPAVLIDLARTALATFRTATPLIARYDAEGVRAVFALERTSDQLTKSAYAALAGEMRAEATHLAERSHLLRATGRLEAICDACAELAEETVFLHQGRSIRHDHGELA